MGLACAVPALFCVGLLRSAAGPLIAGGAGIPQWPFVGLAGAGILLGPAAWFLLRYDDGSPVPPDWWPRLAVVLGGIGAVVGLVMIIWPLTVADWLGPLGILLAGLFVLTVNSSESSQLCRIFNRPGSSGSSV